MSLVVGLMHAHLISFYNFIISIYFKNENILKGFLKLSLVMGKKSNGNKRKKGKILKVLKVKNLKVKSCCLVVSGDADS